MRELFFESLYVTFKWIDLRLEGLHLRLQALILRLELFKLRIERDRLTLLLLRKGYTVEEIKEFAHDD